MKQIIAAGLALVLGACVQTPVSPVSQMSEGGRPPSGCDRAKLDALKTTKFEIADEAGRRAFAMALTACLASPDPELRDGIAYETLTSMLRGRQLSVETMKALLVDLTAKLEGPEGDGFVQPFAALALSEVARADRVGAYLTDDELIALLVDAQHWFVNVKDYRGFDEREGWRHGVAHGADLLMQLALNPRIDAEGLRVIVSAVGAQVAPKGHAYVFGESERLARPVLFAASRGAMDEAKWTEWLKAVATPPDGVELFGSEAGLAWLHDTKAFLQALYVNVTLGSDRADDVMLPGLESALKELP